MNPLNNQKIDFLPASYLLQRKHHRHQQFRLLTCVAVIALCLLGTYGQQTQLSGLQARKRALEQHYSQLQTQLADQHQLKLHKQKLEAKADLLALLRLRPSISRLLAEVTACRPQHISLSSFILESAPHPRSATAKNNATEEEEKTNPVKLASLLDLQQLREHRNMHDLKIQVTGTAPDDVAISSYLAALEQTGITRSVRLIYTDHYPFRDEQLRKFVIELVIRKPDLPTSQPATSVAAKLAD